VFILTWQKILYQHQQNSICTFVHVDLCAGSCPQLELLNVEGSWGVGNQGLAALAGQDGGMVIFFYIIFDI
jgi:hypothetical protein